MVELSARLDYGVGNRRARFDVMNRKLRNVASVLALAALMAACASSEGVKVEIPSTGGIYKIGQPYQIEGTWYYPREQPNYDQTGVASWYGPTFYGGRTANGESFDADALTAAHRTLPMPSIVRVTNLENGKSLLVRVNDRGPFAKGRIIDLSEQAAKLLGFYQHGTARVRVTYVGPGDINGVPPSQTPTEIASAGPAAPTPDVATSTLASVPGAAVAPAVQVAQLPAPAPAAAIDPPGPPQPNGQVTEVPVPATTHLYIQAGAFSSYANADRLRDRLAAAGHWAISAVQSSGHLLYRVRLGPFDAVEDADAALDKLTGLGSNDAQIVVDR